MTDEEAQQRVLRLKPRLAEFEERVHNLAEKSEQVRWSRHALERMTERDIPLRVALEVLRRGYVVGHIEPGSNPGEWKAKIVRNVKGQRDVGVIAITVRNDHILVKTVEWEDPR